MSLTAAGEHLENPAAGNVTANQRRFVILIDFSNLEASLKTAGIGFQKFDWLLRPILKYGEVTFAFVFVPQLANTRLPIVGMANLFNFKVVQCPRPFSNRGISKDKDSVDATMIDMGISMIEHTDCTDVIIVSGDADFARFTARAMHKRKRVYVMSTRDALSGDFKKLENEDIVVKYIE